MSEWSYVSLKDVFNIARGGSPRPIDRFITEDPDGINWIMISDASDSSKYITKTKKRIKQSGAGRSRFVNPGDFLLTNSMSFGRPYIMKTSGCIHDGWLVLSPQRDDVDQDYFYHLLSSKTVYSEFERRAAGATVKNLNIELVSGVQVPLPPIAQQKRIAAILDKADELRSLRRQALEQLDAIAQSTFLEMFGNPSANPKGWERRPLLDLCDIDAPLIDPKKPEYLDLLHYGPDRIERDTGELLPAKTAREDGIESVKFFFDENYVLYSKIRPYLNKAALTEGKGLCSADVYPVKPKPGILTREFLLMVLLTKDFLDYASGFSNRANIPKINRDQFLSYSMIHPPISLQEEFTCRFKEIKRLKTLHRESLAQLDALFASLQHRAFRGEL